MTEANEEIQSLLERLNSHDPHELQDGLDAAPTYIHEVSVRTRILELLQHDLFAIGLGAADIVIQYRSLFGSLETIPDLTELLLRRLAIEDRLKSRAAALQDIATICPRTESTLEHLTTMFSSYLEGEEQGCTGEMTGEDDMPADVEHAIYKYAFIHAIEQVASQSESPHHADLLRPTELFIRCLSDSHIIHNSPDGPSTIAREALRALGYAGHISALGMLLEYTSRDKAQHLRVAAVQALRTLLSRISPYGEGEQVYRQVADTLSPLLYDDAIEDRWPDHVIANLPEPWRSIHSLDDTWTYPTLSEVIVETLAWLINWIPVPALVEWRKWYIEMIRQHPSRRTVG